MVPPSPRPRRGNAALSAGGAWSAHDVLTSHHGRHNTNCVTAHSTHSEHYAYSFTSRPYELDGIGVTVLCLSDMPKQRREPQLVRRLQADARGLPFIRIPKTLATALGWERGDEIEIRLTGRATLELRKVGKG